VRRLPRSHGRHHPEHRRDHRRTPRTAPACGTTRRNSSTIAPHCALPGTTRDAPWRPSNCRFQTADRVCAFAKTSAHPSRDASDELPSCIWQSSARKA
jgi:hypothetical protein